MFDLERSAHFYRDALGMKATQAMEIGGRALERLTRIPRGQRGRIQLFNSDYCVGRLELVEWNRGEQCDRFDDERPRRAVTDCGAVIVCFQVPLAFLEVLYSRLTTAGYRCWSAPVDIATFDGGGRAFVVDDPDGNAIEVVGIE